MRLALKLILAVVASILLVVVAFDYFAARADVRTYEARVADGMATNAQGLSATLPRVAANEGAAAAEELVAQRNQHNRVQIRWVTLDAPRGSPRAVELPAAVLAELRRGQPAHFIKGKQLFVYRPFVGQREVRDVVEASESLAPLQAHTREQILGMVAESAAIVLVAIAAMFVIGVRLIGHPVEKLVAQARRIGTGDLSQRLTLSGHNELSELATEMNMMCDRLREAYDRLVTEHEAKLAAVGQLRHRDRLATVGQLASGVAHELGTPLNIVAGHANLIGSGEGTPEEDRDSAREIASQAERMTAIIRQLLDFARRERPHLEEGDLRSVAERTTRMLAPLAAQRGVELTLAPADGHAPVRIDAGQLQQVIANLVINAVQATLRGGRVDIAVHTVRARRPEGGAERDWVCLAITDQGVGIPKENLARIFEPFFTTKDVGEGSGLGLSVCYGIVEEHGGFITVDSEVQKGSCFSVFLPVAAGDERGESS